MDYSVALTELVTWLEKLQAVIVTRGGRDTIAKHQMAGDIRILLLHTLFARQIFQSTTKYHQHMLCTNKISRQSLSERVSIFGFIDFANFSFFAFQTHTRSYKYGIRIGLGADSW